MTTPQTPPAPPSPPAPPTPTAEKASSQATTSLVLGIISLVCCAFLGPVAWYMGHQETQRIRAGTSAAAGEGVAKAGMILGIIGTVFLVFGMLWFLFFGGMAFLSAMSGE